MTTILNGPDLWRSELIAAGWREVRLNVWQAPNGGLFRGPYGAWRALHDGHGDV